MRRPELVSTLIVAAGLDKQFTCEQCGALLEAFGREDERNPRWSCDACKVPGATIACTYDAKGTS